MKILIAGCGKVGEALIRQLVAEKNDVTVIDSNAKKLEKLTEQYDIIAVQGNGASIETLKQAGAEQADLMIVAGTSLTVYPAAGFVNYYRGNRLVLINRDETPYDNNANLIFRESIGQVLSDAIFF